MSSTPSPQPNQVNEPVKVKGIFTFIKVNTQPIKSIWIPTKKFWSGRNVQNLGFDLNKIRIKDFTSIKRFIQAQN